MRVGVIVSDIANPHFFGMVRGAGRQAAAADYSLGGPTDKAGRAAIELTLMILSALAALSLFLLLAAGGVALVVTLLGSTARMGSQSVSGYVSVVIGVAFFAALLGFTLILFLIDDGATHRRERGRTTR